MFDDGDFVLFDIFSQKSVTVASIIGCSETKQNLWESLVLFLHFLVMAAALLSFTSSHEFSHTCEYPVHSPQAAVHEMAMMNLEKPVISLIFLHRPVSEQLIRVFLPLHVHTFVLFLLYLV